jgi:hypothetical protein
MICECRFPVWRERKRKGSTAEYHTQANAAGAIRELKRRWLERDRPFDSVSGLQSNRDALCSEFAASRADRLKRFSRAKPTNRIVKQNPFTVCSFWLHSNQENLRKQCQNTKSAACVE